MNTVIRTSRSALLLLTGLATSQHIAFSTPPDSTIGLPANMATSPGELWFGLSTRTNQAPTRNGETNEIAGLGIEAIEETRAGAEKGIAVAQYRLAHYYYAGLGVPQDYAEAVKWLRKSAEQSYCWAQCALGIAYEAGKIVPPNHAEAVKWYGKASAQGVAPRPRREEGCRECFSA